MFGRKRSKGHESTDDQVLLVSMVETACERYLAGPGLQISPSPLPQGVEVDWDPATSWNPDRLQRVLIVHLPGSMGWVSFLESPPTDSVGENSEEAASLAGRQINPLTLKYKAPAATTPMGAEDMARVLRQPSFDALDSLSQIEIEVRASRDDSHSWSL